METNHANNNTSTPNPEADPAAKQAKRTGEKRDYYQVLEVARNAEEKDIKKAFRKLAMKYHPVSSVPIGELILP